MKSVLVGEERTTPAHPRWSKHCSTVTSGRGNRRCTGTGDRGNHKWLLTQSEVPQAFCFKRTPTPFWEAPNKVHASHCKKNFSKHKIVSVHSQIVFPWLCYGVILVLKSGSAKHSELPEHHGKQQNTCGCMRTPGTVYQLLWVVCGQKAVVSFADPREVLKMRKKVAFNF